MARNQPINIPISAEDRFTKTVDKLEQRIARLAGPVKRFQHNIGRLDSFGPRQLRQGFLGLSSAAVGTAKKFAAIVPILGTITGAASLAGIYRLSSAWAGMGRQLGISSRLIGVAPQRLQALGNAARLAGGSAEGMQATLQGLVNTSFNARTGLDPQALAQFQAFGITAHELKDDAPDQLFERVASQIRKLRTPLERARAAQALFGSGAEAVIPILLQSGSAWRRNIELARRYGVVNEDGVAAANRLATSQTRLELAVEGFGNTLAQTVEPVLSPIIARLADWISANRQLIATRITEYVQRLVAWFNDGGWDRITKWAGNFVSQAGRIAQALGGWQRVAIASGAALGLIVTAPLLAGMTTFLLALIKIRNELRAVGTESVRTQQNLAHLGRPGPAGAGGRRGLFDRAASGFLVGAGAASAFDNADGGGLEDKVGIALGAYNPVAGAAWEAATNFTSPGGIVENSLKRLLGARPHSTADRAVNWLFADGLTDAPYSPDERYSQREYAALRGAVSADDHRAKLIADRLSRHGFSQAQIAGILANFSQESRFSTTAQNGSHAGLAQWDKDRQEQFRKRYGHALTDGSIAEQVDFFADDLKKHRSAWAALQSARTPEDAGFAIGRHYEIPGTTDATLRPDVNARARASGDWSKVVAAWLPRQSAPQAGSSPQLVQVPAQDNRQDGGDDQVSRAWADRLKNIQPSPVVVRGERPHPDTGQPDSGRRQIIIPAASAPPVRIVQAPPPSGPEPGASRTGQDDDVRNERAAAPRVVIDINHQNAPSGVQVRTSSSSDQVGIGRLRVHRAMSPDAPSL